MVKIAVEYTVAWVETVRLLQAPLLVLKTGSLLAAARNRWKQWILRINIGNRRNMCSTRTVR